MSRPIFLGNGAMLVGLDKDGFVYDFYYPYVGLENHASSRDLHHRIGVWVDGDFTWLDDGSWDISLDYSPVGLIGHMKAVCSIREITLEFHDAVDSQYNVFSRNIHVVNNSKFQKDIRVFLHQVFRISDSNRDDTAQYMPDDHVLVHYRGRRVFVIGGEHADGTPFDQFSIGLHGIEGHEGTYKDAEDGELSSHPVEHGRVDSTIRYSIKVEPLSSSRIRYWITAASSKSTALELHNKFVGEGFYDRFQTTEQSWQDWLAIGSNQLHKIDKQFHDSTIKSLLIIKSHIDKRGSVIASGDSAMLNYARDYYSYCWPRDAAYALWPLVRLGYFHEAKMFFEFARDTLHEDGYLMHKYQPDRALGSSWHPYIVDNKSELPIQEDETAIVLFLLSEFYKTAKDEDFVRSMYKGLVQPAANFMDSYIDSDTKLPHASYDLWEQKFSTSTYTTALVYSSLVSAAALAEEFEFPDDAIRWRTVAEDIRSNAQDAFFNSKKQFFYKGFTINNKGMLEYDETIDSSSLYGAAMFGLYDINDDRVSRAIETLENTLVDKSNSGGVPRYEYDEYYATKPNSLGNPWFVTTLWYAQILIEKGRVDKAREIVQWAMSKMLKSGALPEQIDPDSSKHISVEPLVWSQAEFINTVLDLM
jgi:GH15 family glucan-1,4-alpha-glucosidase